MSLPTVSFYILDDSCNLEQCNNFLFRLIKKIFYYQLSIIVLCQHDQQAQHLNDILWQFQASSFIPHIMIMPPPASLSQQVLTNTPIRLSTTENIVLSPSSQVMLNLTQDIPSNPSQYQRIVEFVSPLFYAKNYSRAHYRYYQQQGFHIENHSIHH